MSFIRLIIFGTLSFPIQNTEPYAIINQVRKRSAISRKRTRKSFASVEILSTAAQLCKNYTQNFFRVDSSDASLLKRLSTDDPWNQSHREWRHSCNDVLSRFDIGLVQLWRTNTYKTIIMYRVSIAASRGKNVTATSMSTCANVVKSCRNRERHTRRQLVFSPVRY